MKHTRMISLPSIDCEKRSFVLLRPDSDASVIPRVIASANKPDNSLMTQKHALKTGKNMEYGSYRHNMS